MIEYVIKSGELFGHFKLTGSRRKQPSRVRGASWRGGYEGKEMATRFPSKDLAEHVAAQVRGTDGTPTVHKIGHEYVIQAAGSRTYWLCRATGRKGGATEGYEWRQGKAGRVYAARFSTEDEAQTLIDSNHQYGYAGGAVAEIVEVDE